MRLLLMTIGSHGDVHPFLAIGRALKRRGHEVALATNPYFEKQIAREGLHPIALTKYVDLQEVMTGSKIMDPLRGPMVVLKEIILPGVPEVVENTRNAIRDFQPDLGVLHHFCLGARWPFEEKAIPTAVCALSPCTWFNPRDTLVMPSFRSETPGRLTVKFDLWLGRAVLAGILDKPLNRIRVGMGLKPGKHWMHVEPFAGELALGMWSPHFRGPMEGDPSNSTVCGFPWHDRDEEREDAHHEWDQFLNDGAPPIVFCLGTAAVHTAGKFYHAAAEACRLLNRRGMLLVGRTDLLGETFPPGVRAFAYAPFSRVFPRAAANVHHGGIGSTGQGLRAGRPTVICPLSHDQYDNAARCARLGVSRTLKHSKVRADRLAEALRAVLEDPNVQRRAADLGAKVAQEEGAEIAADRIEGFATAPSKARAIN